MPTNASGPGEVNRTAEELMLIDPPSPFGSEVEWRCFAVSMDEAEPTAQIRAMRELAKIMLDAFAAGGQAAAIDAYREPFPPE